MRFYVLQQFNTIIFSSVSSPQRVSVVPLSCLLRTGILGNKDLAGNGSQPPSSWS